MFRPRRFNDHERKAVILLVVVSLLTLFAVVGLTFVLYSENTASSLRAWREAQQGGHTTVTSPTARGNPFEAPPIPEDIFNQFLGQFIYDVPDDATGLYSALRGQSLARTIYGWTGTAGQNITPYNGVGRLRADTTNFPLINYAGDTTRKPEWWGPGNIQYIPANAPYTYPDENNASLAAIRAADGKVLVPSFFRPWVINPSAPVTLADFQNPANQYKMFRPIVANGFNPNFPPPLQNTDGSFGDVENLQGKLASTQQRYDSFWMDIDLPMHMWRGRYYKPLIAPLIVDLDGRINLNVAGNIKNTGNTHGSNQGWGRWEINLAPVLGTAPLNATYAQTIVGTRYNINEAPIPIPTKVFEPVTGTAATDAAAGQTPHFYGQVDFDGADGSAKLAALQPWYTSPVYPQAVYQNGSGGPPAGERYNHPLIYNPYLLKNYQQTSPAGVDRTFNLFDMFLLNGKFNNDDLSYRRAELGQIVPTAFGASFYTPGTANPRFLSTLASNDIDRVGIIPWQQDPTNAAYSYQQPAQANGATPATPPGGQPIPFPTVPPAAPLDPLKSDFSLMWQSRIAAFGGVDLNRRLRDYRTDPTQPWEAAGNVTAAQAQLAIQDRQQFAKDIYDRLVYATGANPQATSGTPEFNALRWLAQLAVNIVDYIDNDDYMTPFQWNPTNAPTEILWGTELPRLVLNEVYMQWSNDPADPFTGNKATLPYWFRIWAELHNPLTNPPSNSDASLSHNGQASIKFNGTDIYQIGLAASPQNNLRSITNLDGSPDGGMWPPLPPANPSGITGAGPNILVPLSNATQGDGTPTGNPGFFLVGPPNQANNGPDPVPGNDNVVPQGYLPLFKQTIQLGQSPAPVTIFLRRLACPHLPPDPNPGSPTYNPYVTVDYVETQNGKDTSGQGPIYDWRKYDDQMQLNPSPRQPLSQHHSFGRTQPYAGNPSRYVQQDKNPPPANDDAINHTFYRHNQGNGPNGTVAPDNPFDWLVHLDRQVASPVELFNVSAWKPHELTQQFIIGQGALTPAMKNLHLAAWNQPITIPPNPPITPDQSRLYRALALLQTRDRTNGMPFGGRLPGKVNINTIWDREELNAICDLQGANGFLQADVDNTWNQPGGLFQTRTPGLLAGQISGSDLPFLGLAAPVVPNGDVQYTVNGTTVSGVARTFLRQGANTFDLDPTTHPAAQQPYMRNELLSKVFSDFTTRSNVFAVWCTIGYFEVENAPAVLAGTARPQLGRELGSQDGSNVRHRFFSIIDRTNLAIDTTDPTLNQPAPGQSLRTQGFKPVFLSFEADPLAAVPGVVTVTVPATGTRVNTDPVSGAQHQVLMGYYDGQPWELAAPLVPPPGMGGVGTQLVVDVGPNQEFSQPTATPPTSVMVAAVNFAPPNPLGMPPTTTPTATIQFIVSKPHSRGCVIMFNPQFPTNTLLPPAATFPPPTPLPPSVLLGNPGPQPGFNYKSDRYRGVVPLVVQVDQSGG